METITQKETIEKKLYPIFNAAKIKVKIKEPKLNTQQAESAEFQETDDAHCIEAARAAENAEKMGGGPPLGAVPFLNSKAPTEISQAGNPPIGKERGTLGVGTVPTPPATGQ